MITLTTEEAIKELSRYTDQEFYTPQNRAAHQMAIEALERGRWIPVEERLPEDRTWVLVCHTGYNTPKKAFYKDTGIDVFRLDGDDHSNGAVTHWMPLPAPPVQEANRENTACEWCEPGHEVCGTCERFFFGLATGCATESTDEKCAVYVPADHCMKCGRSLRPPAGTNQKG